MRRWVLFAVGLMAVCAALASESPPVQPDRDEVSLEKPALAWATYIGLEGLTGAALDVAVDSKGNAIVVGTVGFPAVGAVGQTRPADGFIAKVSPEGRLLWLTRVGGGAHDSCREVAVDRRDNAYVVGSTQSADFPAPGGFDTTLSGPNDAFVVEVTPDGEISWGTFLGGGEGAGGEYAAGIAVDGAGNIWVSGGTDSPDFPVPGGTSPAADGSKAFIARISSAKVYEKAWLYGDGADEKAGELTLDDEGHVWFLCSRKAAASGGSIPGAARLQSVVRLSVPDGAWKAYDRQGGCFFESIARAQLPPGLDMDARDLRTFTRESRILAAGTMSTDAKVPICGVALKLRLDGVPVWTSDIRRTLRGDGAFIQSAAGLAGLCQDRRGRLWVCGAARLREGDIPESFGRPSGGGDGYVALLGDDGLPAWECLLSGSGLDHAYAIAADGRGGIYVVGDTFSQDFATPGAYDTQSGGSAEAFVARIIHASQDAKQALAGGIS